MTCQCIKLDTIFVGKKMYKTALEKCPFSFFFVYVCFYVFPSPHSAITSQIWVLFCCDGFVFLSGSLSCRRWMVSRQPLSLSLSLQPPEPEPASDQRGRQFHRRQASCRPELCHWHWLKSGSKWIENHARSMYSLLRSKIVWWGVTLIWLFSVILLL